MVEKKKTATAKKPAVKTVAKSAVKSAAKKTVAKPSAKAAVKTVAKKTATVKKSVVKVVAKPTTKKAAPVAKKPAVKKTPVAKKVAVRKVAEVKTPAPKVEARPAVKAKACKCSCGGKAILFLIIVAVVVAGLSWLYCCTSSAKADFLSSCQKSEAECVCMADYMDQNLNRSEYKQAITILTSDKPEQYLVAGIFTGDKIAQVITKGTLLCMKE